MDLSKTRVPKIDESTIPNTWLANTLIKVEVLNIVRTIGDDSTAEVTVGTLAETIVVGDPREIVLGKISRNDVPKIIK